MKVTQITCAIVCALSLPAVAQISTNVQEQDDYFDDFYGSEGMVEMATGIKTQKHKAPAVASIFTAEQIKTMGANDIDDVLETVPGLHIARSAVSYNSIYSFRGVHSSYNSQVLMLINGVPITNNFIGNRNQVWGGMPVEAIARIEVIRGPGSAVLGADAFAGVINLITKTAEDITQNEVGARVGENNTRDAWFTFGGHQGDLKYSSILEYHKTDGSDKTIKADAQTALDSVFGTDVSHAPGELSLGTENIDFRGELNYQSLRVRAGYQLRNNTGVGAGLGEALDPSAKQKSERYNVDVTYVSQLTDNFELTTQGSYFDTSQEIKNNYLIYPKGADLGFGAPFTEGFIGNPENWERHTRVNFTGLYTGIDKHTLRGGIGYYYSDLHKTKESKNFGFGPEGEWIVPGSPVVDVSDTPYIYLSETDRTNKYIFIQDVWTLANDWELTAGVRYDDYDDFGDTTNPRLALVWSTSLNLSTKLLYGKAFRAPSYVDTGSINNPVALGNPDLNPEKMETTELAFDYHPGDGVAAVWSFYYYEWDDIIQYIPDEGQPSATAQNYGKQIAYGSEFELSYLLHDNLNLSGNYAWSKATNKKTDSDVAFVPEQQLYIQLDWDISEDLKLNMKNNFVNNRKRNTGDLRSDIDDYWISDLTLRWAPHNIPVEVALLGKNIFDEDAREPSNNNGAAVNLPDDLPLAGRSLFAELRYSF